MKDKDRRMIYTFLVSINDNRKVVMVTTACNVEDALSNLSKNSGFTDFKMFGYNVYELDSVSIIYLSDFL